MEFKTEHENFWAGDFGDQYIARNNSDSLFYSKVAMWARMLRCANNVRSARELGCNIGLNLLTLKRLNPALELSGYEINEAAANKAAELNVGKIVNGTILDKINDPSVDLTFTVGVLIHIDPDYLKLVYDNLVYGSNRFVLVAEYYNPSPVTIAYRGHSNRLFKRDFAGDLIDSYGLKLIDYGFIYKRDNLAPQDDIHWFLLEK
ncbi:pseudaminic acid biosynthesis-associated methylase [Ancylobacter vacuolatus]|uniref:Pseudaminic acid biosynthesis-associated methylase n=1 Tax=Ancylobacter vacuolatus TaxID=223389 RepID=A0ABU0DBM2_9HYPH|nr:pseudaminic acid biosynthesis-associated methylase [Ancylobacter vacuolatus]MDQ0345809.1 pseudaminic acid biosynthesis-associated methylase [Ancylobacter vacuolatus]